MTKTTSANRLQKEAGFTLIELSIVLVIIGLIVGGVLVGQDLIRAAEVRSQIAQIEKFNVAVNTFRGKFNSIPGDMAVSVASQFGFTTTSCTAAAGLRDGNGLVEAGAATSTTNVQGISGYETTLLWQDLSSSTGGNLIDFAVTGQTCAALSIPSTNVGGFLPAAKIGRGQYVSVYNYAGYNWWGLFGLASTTSGSTNSPTTPMSVIQAYNIDKKMDDGIANSGNTVVQYISGTTLTATGGNLSAATADTTHCYESTGGTYNIAQNNGNGSYCALGFRFQ